MWLANPKLNFDSHHRKSLDPGYIRKDCLQMCSEHSGDYTGTRDHSRLVWTFTNKMKINLCNWAVPCKNGDWLHLVRSVLRFSCKGNGDWPLETATTCMQTLWYHFRKEKKPVNLLSQNCKLAVLSYLFWLKPFGSDKRSRSFLGSNRRFCARVALRHSLVWASASVLDLFLGSDMQLTLATNDRCHRWIFQDGSSNGFCICSLRAHWFHSSNRICFTFFIIWSS